MGTRGSGQGGGVGMPAEGQSVLTRGDQSSLELADEALDFGVVQPRAPHEAHHHPPDSQRGPREGQQGPRPADLKGVPDSLWLRTRLCTALLRDARTAPAPTWVVERGGRRTSSSESTRRPASAHAQQHHAPKNQSRQLGCCGVHAYPTCSATSCCLAFLMRILGPLRYLPCTRTTCRGQQANRVRPHHYYEHAVHVMTARHGVL